MISLKHKQNNQPSFIQHLNSHDPKTKTKKNHEPASKSNKVQIKDANVLTQKRKNHLPSKSTIDRVEHIHYNSPNYELISKESHNDNFTFTHILQQHAHNIQKTSQNNRSGNDFSHSYIYSCNEKPYNDKFYDKDISSIEDARYSHGISQSKIVSQIQFSNMLNSKLSMLNAHQNRDTSVQKENRKSPIRLVNSNKLNNTPKIREKHSQKTKQTERIQGKTFAALIKPSLQISNHQNQEIDLQCSQKIQKIAKVIPQQKLQKVKFEQKYEEGRNKSNLLSTGLITISQPSQLTNRTRAPISKETIQSKLFIDNIISEQKVKIFSQECERDNVDICQKIKEIKLRSIDFMNKIIEKKDQSCQNEGFQDFLQQIQMNFNPEISEEDSRKQINQLKDMKRKVQTIFVDIIQKLKESRDKICKQIQGKIQIVTNSSYSQINWLAIAQNLEQKDSLKTRQLKNDFLLKRIDTIQKQVRFNDINSCHQQKRFEIIQEVSILQEALLSLTQKPLLQVHKNGNKRVEENKQNLTAIFRKRLQLYLQKLQNLLKNIQIGA